MLCCVACVQDFFFPLNAARFVYSSVRNTLELYEFQSAENNATVETGIEISVALQQQVWLSYFMVQTVVSVIILLKIVSYLVLHSYLVFERQR